MHKYDHSISSAPRAVQPGLVDFGVFQGDSVFFHHIRPDCSSRVLALALVSTTELLLRTSTWTIRKVPAVHAALIVRVTGCDELLLGRVLPSASGKATTVLQPVIVRADGHARSRFAATGLCASWFLSLGGLLGSCDSSESMIMMAGSHTSIGTGRSRSGPCFTRLV